MEIRVLFVCLGNICRSPMAEGIFQKMVNDAGLSDRILADSAGTAAYHIGELPDPRMRRTAQKNGIILTHRARKIEKPDLEAFDYILAMDDQNLKDIQRLQTTPHIGLHLMRSFGGNNLQINVPDPYYEDDAMFDEVYEILVYHNTHLLNHIIQKHLR